MTLEQVLNCPGLPSLPAVAVEVLNLTRNRNVQLEQIARVIQNDPALCARILKTVNSSFFGLSKPCPTMTRALSYLGLNTVKSLVLGFSLVDWIESSDDVEDLQEYWRRSVCTAAAARRLAALTAICEPDEAFVAALIQDIGVLVIRRALGAAHAAVMAACKGDHDRLAEACRAAFGFDHPMVGAALAERWRLPSSIIQAIRHHHADPEALNDHPPIIQIVASCNQLVSAIDGRQNPALMNAVRANLHQRFTISPDRLDAFIAGAMNDARELAALLPGLTGEIPDSVSVLAQAEDARIQHQLELQREAERLQQDNRDLMRLASTDPLTGVGNRKEFEAQLTAALTHARLYKGCLALLMVDIDRFKVVNDTFGHVVGDSVLSELARRMRAVIEGAGSVCRYGGEEFAVILPGVHRARALKAAESVRRAIADKPFAIGASSARNQTTPVTVSVGVVLYEPSPLPESEAAYLLLQSADKAMYAAKNSGRNAVRVYEKHLRKMSA